MCQPGSAASASRLAVLCGALSLATLFTAFVSNVWLFTSEPVRLPNSDQFTTVTFRIGLWRVCPSVSKTNTFRHVPSPACSLVKYSSWEEVTHSDLGIWTTLDFTPAFVTRMRYAMPFLAVSLVLLLLATMYILVGHCSEDHRTLVAVGLYILGGLSLGGSLVVFVSVLSDAYLECPQKPTAFLGYSRASLPGSAAPFSYQYGWSFFAAGAAIILAELAGLLSITAFFRRLPVLDDVVRIVAPSCSGRDPHWTPHQHTRLLNGPASIWGSDDGAVDAKPAPSPPDDVLDSVVPGAITLSNAEPDICRSNPARVVKVRKEARSSDEDGPAGSPRLLRQEPGCLVEDCGGSGQDDMPGQVVGVTVPIKLVRPQPQVVVRPVTYLYGEPVHAFATLPRGSSAGHRTTSRTSSDSSAAETAYSTLQPHRGKNVTISTFSAVNTFELAKGNAWTNSEV